MKDQELLRLAAKAAGMTLTRAGYKEAVRHGEDHMDWNPRDDDGDALRLFLALPWMALETSDVGVSVRERPINSPDRVYYMFTEWLHDHDGDLRAATRRAILRAAAELGKKI